MRDYIKLADKLSNMTDTQLWQHYAELNRQLFTEALEEISITLGALEKRGYVGLITDGEVSA